jgi:adenine-specific DNA-methyltransferase
MKSKIKNLGQVYTPKHIVNDMLDLIAYKGEQILQKHIIDNSCGNGAFLVEIIERYIKAYKQKNNSLCGIENDLSKYIHGIEIDKTEWAECIKNLNRIYLNKTFKVLNGTLLTQIHYK